MAALLIGLLADSARAQAPREIVIGVIYPLSCTLAEIGIDSVTAIRMGACPRPGEKVTALLGSVHSVDQRSIPGLVELVCRLHAGGTALIVIEHNMRVIIGISGRVVALHLGGVIAIGPPAAVTSDARVIEAYLGRAYAG